ncbi:unnamed protein product [Strongylus vulgaris]|uniref:Uncharacterized protein n=1 Tax=Strongylus vulgaris TaxID=40348 RepID=A0A3P7KBP2_STRVU|nr:unnamed protein product [Strongylus vulgaris]
MELTRREEELMRMERRLRERTPPRAVQITMPPHGNGTFPKKRPGPRQRSKIQKKKRRQKMLDTLEVRLPQKRGVNRARDVVVTEEPTILPKRRKEANQECKGEEEGDTAFGKAERKQGHLKPGQRLEGLVESIIGSEVLDDYTIPRKRALTQLLSLCDINLLSAEVLKKFGIVEAKTEPTEKEAYKKRSKRFVF